MSGVIAGLDIGTSKIRVVVGECNDNGTFEIIGVGSCLSTGLQKGIIRNIDVTCNSVKAAVESAEIMSGRDIETLFVGIGGPNIESVNSTIGECLDLISSLLVLSELERLVFPRLLKQL